MHNKFRSVEMGWREKTNDEVYDEEEIQARLDEELPNWSLEL